MVASLIDSLHTCDSTAGAGGKDDDDYDDGPAAAATTVTADGEKGSKDIASLTIDVSK